MLGNAEKYLTGTGRVGWSGLAALALHWLVGHGKAATRLLRSLRAVAVRDAPQLEHSTVTSPGLRHPFISFRT